MERFLNFPQCVSVLDQSDVRGNFTDLGGQACEVFLGLFHKYLDPDKPFFRFNSYSFTQHESGDLRKIKVCVNLRKVGHPTLRKLSTARKGL